MCTITNQQAASIKQAQTKNSHTFAGQPEFWLTGDFVFITPQSISQNELFPTQIPPKIKSSTNTAQHSQNTTYYH